MRNGKIAEHHLFKNKASPIQLHIQPGGYEAVWDNVRASLKMGFCWTGSVLVIKFILKINRFHLRKSCRAKVRICNALIDPPFICEECRCTL
jgi:hypothetical protein